MQKVIPARIQAALDDESTCTRLDVPTTQALAWVEPQSFQPNIRQSIFFQEPRKVPGPAKRPRVHVILTLYMSGRPNWSCKHLTGGLDIAPTQTSTSTKDISITISRCHPAQTPTCPPLANPRPPARSRASVRTPSGSQRTRSQNPHRARVKPSEKQRRCQGRRPGSWTRKLGTQGREL